MSGAASRRGLHGQPSAVCSSRRCARRHGLAGRGGGSGRLSGRLSGRYGGEAPFPRRPGAGEREATWRPSGAGGELLLPRCGGGRRGRSASARLSSWLLTRRRTTAWPKPSCRRGACSSALPEFRQLTQPGPVAFRQLTYPGGWPRRERGARPAPSTRPTAGRRSPPPRSCAGGTPTPGGCGCSSGAGARWPVAGSLRRTTHTAGARLRPGASRRPSLLRPRYVGEASHPSLRTRKARFRAGIGP